LSLVAHLTWIALGSALGGILRYFVSGAVTRLTGDALPWGTLAVNGSGAAAIGIVAACAQADLVDMGANVWSMLVIGLLASYTTVSSVSLQTLALARQGAAARAVANVLLSLLVCLGAVGVTYAAAAALLGAAAP
jgi:fluoride exporter